MNKKEGAYYTEKEREENSQGILDQAPGCPKYYWYMLTTYYWCMLIPIIIPIYDIFF